MGGLVIRLTLGVMDGRAGIYGVEGKFGSLAGVVSGVGLLLKLNLPILEPS